MDVKFLVDTGSKFTLLHSDVIVWQLLPDRDRGTLEPCNLPLVGVGGEPLKVQGKGVVNLALGKVRTKHTVYVTTIVNSGILGIDFLQSHGGILDLQNGYLQFDPPKRLPGSTSSDGWSSPKPVPLYTVIGPCCEFITRTGTLALEGQCVAYIFPNSGEFCFSPKRENLPDWPMGQCSYSTMVGKLLNVYN